MLLISLGSRGKKCYNSSVEHTAKQAPEMRFPMYKNIFVNQCGYLPNMQKQVTFRTDQPLSFTVVKSCGTSVYSGRADRRVENPSAGETNYIGDFSAVTESGLYYITAEGLGESDTFAVGENAYADTFQKSMAFFYLQRCGYNIPREAAGIYGHKACHTQIGHVFQGAETKDVTGGWHDAGDYGRYVGPGAMAVAQLLYAAERNDALCGSYQCPENKGAASALPDYLEELKYELDWMMKMQREDGALYHKASCRNFCSFIMPEEETEEMLLSPVSVTATGDFAAVCAMAVRFYVKYDEAYARRLEAASKKAYEAMQGMALPGGFKNPQEITTGEYGDSCDTDERYWAAAELYHAFGDQQYRDDFEAIAREKIYQGYGWADMGSYGNLAYLNTKRPVDESLTASIRQAMLSLADDLLKTAENDGYGTALTAGQYIWGSNMNAANNGLHLYDAWKLTGEQKYLDAAAAQIHYLLGRNCLGLCFVTGCGTDAVKHPHHRPSGFLGRAMPGMLSGGPCSWIADETIKSMFINKTAPAPARCLVDMTGSYSTNEVTIYWNSAFLQLLASVTASDGTTT